jgi:hypothetical protein
MKPHHSAAATPTKARPARAKAATPTPAIAGDTTAAAPTAQREDSIREAAYFYFEARGRVGGHELEDWLRAEAEFERLQRNGTAKIDEPAASH